MEQKSSENYWSYCGKLVLVKHSPKSVWNNRSLFFSEVPSCTVRESESACAKAKRAWSNLGGLCGKSPNQCGRTENAKTVTNLDVDKKASVKKAICKAECFACLKLLGRLGLFDGYVALCSKTTKSVQPHWEGLPQANFYRHIGSHHAKCWNRSPESQIIGKVVLVERTGKKCLGNGRSLLASSKLQTQGCIVRDSESACAKTNKLGGLRGKSPSQCGRTESAKKVTNLDVHQLAQEGKKQ